MQDKRPLILSNWLLLWIGLLMHLQGNKWKKKNVYILLKYFEHCKSHQQIQ